MHRVFRPAILAAVLFSAALGLAPAVVAQSDAQRLPTIAGLSQDRLARLAGVLRTDVAEGRIPGAVILVARDGQVALFEAMGYRDRAREAPMTKDAIFRIYSMTKPIVSVAAMMLVEEGKMQLWDSVSLYLPELKGMKVGVEKTDADGRPVLDMLPVHREIAVRDLLLHTAGLTYGFYGRSLVNEAYRVANLWDTNQTSAEFLAKVAKLPLANHPGTSWDYGQATDVLGMLIERIEGKPLDMVLEERIFRPLGMKDTGFYVPESQLPRLAEPLPQGPTPLGLLNVSRKPVYLAGGHGLVSTAEDYLKFMSMLLNGGALDGARLLGKGTVDYMTSEHLGPTLRGRPGPGYGFGLGFGVRFDAGFPAYPGSVGDYQWAGYAGTLFWVDPRERLVVVLMMQAPTQLSRYSALIRTLVYAALVK